MSYSTSSPGSETAPVPKRRVAALFAACLMLLTTAGVGVASTAGAAQPHPLANPGTVKAVAGGTADPVGSLKVTWTKPVPMDNVAGYIVLLQPEGGLGTTSPFTIDAGTSIHPVMDPSQLSTLITGLTPGASYRVTVISTNGEVSMAFINDMFSLLVDIAAGPASSPVVIPPTVTQPGPRYAFPTVDAMIADHYKEFLDRPATYVERTLWQDLFQTYGAGTGCVGVDATKTAINPPALWGPAPLWGPNPVVTDGKGAQNCPNSGLEYNMISILRTGGSPAIPAPTATSTPFPDWNNTDPYTWDEVNSAWFFAENPTTFQGVINPITRLYFAYFDRSPDSGGLKFWANRFRTGVGSLDDIAQYFANSSEFKRTYPTIVTNADFVSMVYYNVLHRAPDASGMAFWVAQLTGANGTGAAITKGRAMNMFAQSTENIEATEVGTAVVNIYFGLLGRTPTQNELAQNVFWANVANNTAADGSGVAQPALNLWVIQGAVRNSAEYAATK